MSISSRTALAVLAFCWGAGAAGAQDLGPQWPNYNNTYDGQRFAPLKAVTPEAVAGMHETCRVKIADTGSFQTGPIVANGTLYVTTARDTLALDPVTCAVKWRSTWVPEQAELAQNNRGAAYGNGRIFRGTPDGRLLALDAQTGALIWKDVIAETSHSDFVPAAPVVWNGMVIVGTAGGDWGGRGRVMAYDMATGRELWRFNTVPYPDEVGAASWKHPDSAQNGGGGTWTSYTLDVTTGELFVPVGNPAPDFAPQYRPGENLFTDSLVVLDARTGKLKWWYQMIPQDGQDHDLSAPPVLVRTPAGQDLVLLAGKEGYLTAVDRATHKRVYRTAITTIENEGKVPNDTGLHVCPGMLGGVEWNGPAYDPTRQTVFVGSVDWCATYKTEQKHAPYDPSGMYFGGTFVTDPTGGSGWVTALDGATGTIKWRFHAPAPVISGVTPTEGGVVFLGDTAGDFFAFDAVSGKVLHQSNTGGALAGGMVAYEIGGKPYVAFPSGNISRATFGVLGQPSIIVMALGETAAVAKDTADPARGRQVFAETCIACHGPNGNALPDHDLKTVVAKQSQADTEAWIRDPKPPMPKLFPAPLSDQDVRDVAAFVHTL